jgi:uncharacterized protein
LTRLSFQETVSIVFSQELLAEFIEVARRPKFRRFFSTMDLEEILETIGQYADFVKVQTKIEACRDPKDNFLLSLSIDGNADFLLTGDQDLLDLIKFGETTILTISDFLKDK